MHLHQIDDQVRERIASHLEIKAGSPEKVYATLRLAMKDPFCAKCCLCPEDARHIYSHYEGHPAHPGNAESCQVSSRLAAGAATGINTLAAPISTQYCTKYTIRYVRPQHLEMLRQAEQYNTTALGSIVSSSELSRGSCRVTCGHHPDSSSCHSQHGKCNELKLSNPAQL